ncbi:hypothetical protein DM860_011401 [Cuscuta australis]|uniref:glucan endo-1,3-beta-D-glucosidase n=1 Tax=Cuscuta australis TaxID=267555 RepID=A0A328DQX9_9ASTE|nr:hypothetical protein DM860_011401 [Cuscuta australis]
MMGKCKNVLLPLLLLVLHISGFFAAPSGHGEEAFIGVNIGTQISDMPSPTDVVSLLKDQQIRHVRLFNADQAMLKALANTGISVVVTIPNDLIIGIGESNATAAKWVSQNILTHIPSTRITAIAVGSNILATLPNAARVLVNAMNFTHSALVGARLDSQIKVSTPLSSDVILESFPPSRAHFNSSWLGVMDPLLKFLDSTGSYLMLNVYPYFAYVSSNGTIALDYALFRPLPPNKDAIDSSTFLHYTNVFDAMVDAAYFAMLNLSYSNIPVVVTESGWPSKGELSEPDATHDNANTYNSNLISRVLNGIGTPKRPGVAVSTYIYELYNEDKNPGLASQQNWGLFNRIGVAVYTLHLNGSWTMFQNDTKKPTFCVAKQSADAALVQSGLDWACGPGKVNCSPLTQGQPCYDPNGSTRLSSHASYAFDAYYHSQGMTDTECDFRGAATLTTTDPSHGSCLYPGSVGRNGSLTNGTSLVPSTNSTDSGCGSQYLHDSNALIISSLIVCFAFWL